MSGKSRLVEDFNFGGVCTDGDRRCHNALIAAFVLITNRLSSASYDALINIVTQYDIHTFYDEIRTHRKKNFLFETRKKINERNKTTRVVVINEMLPSESNERKNLESRLTCFLSKFEKDICLVNRAAGEISLRPDGFAVTLRKSFGSFEGGGF